jgi:putative transposase
MAVQSSAERAWLAISRFYENCKKKVSGKKGYPRFQHDNRSVEYKTSGWKINPTKRRITLFWVPVKIRWSFASGYWN